MTEIFENTAHTGTIKIINPRIILERPVVMLQACRLAAEHNAVINVETWMAIYQHSKLIKYVTPDQIREEVTKSLSTEKPSIAFSYMEDLLLMDYFFPELAECKRTIQSRRTGVRNVFEHTMYAIDAATMDLSIRLAVLLHDSGKPETMECTPDGVIHFFRHEIIGSEIAKKRLTWLGYDSVIVNKVAHLIFHHMFDPDPKLSPKGVRKLIRRVGIENIYDLLLVREADRQGSPTKISMRKITLLRSKIDEEIKNGIA